MQILLFPRNLRSKLRVKKYRNLYIPAQILVQMKRKREEIHEVNMWDIFTSVFSSCDIANIVFEYSTPFEMRLSHLDVFSIERNDCVIPTRSGWIFPFRKGDQWMLRTTFNDFQTEFVEVAFQFWDHTMDDDLIVVLYEREQGQYEVRTWDVWNQVLVAKFDLDSSWIYECNMIHLPQAGTILSWCWDTAEGGFLYFLDYWAERTITIQFSKRVYFLDVVFLAEKEISLLFHTAEANSFLKVHGDEIKFPNETNSFFWLDLPRCTLRRENNPKHGLMPECYRFYQQSYGSRRKWHDCEIESSRENYFEFKVESSGILDLWLGKEKDISPHFSVNINDLVRLPSSNCSIFKLRLYAGPRRDFAVFCEASSNPYGSCLSENTVYLFLPRNKAWARFLPAFRP